MDFCLFDFVCFFLQTTEECRSASPCLSFERFYTCGWWCSCFSSSRFFAPHPSDLTSIQSFYDDPLNRGWCALDEIWSRVLQDAINQGRRRIFLWGGVKAENQRAIKFYERHGFIRLGTFLHEGENLDMVYLVDARNWSKLYLKPSTKISCTWYAYFSLYSLLHSFVRRMPR